MHHFWALWWRSKFRNGFFKTFQKQYWFRAFVLHAGWPKRMTKNMLSNVRMSALDSSDSFTSDSVPFFGAFTSVKTQNNSSKLYCEHSPACSRTEYLVHGWVAIYQCWDTVYDLYACFDYLSTLKCDFEKGPSSKSFPDPYKKAFFFKFHALHRRGDALILHPTSTPLHCTHTISAYQSMLHHKVPAPPPPPPPCWESWIRPWIDNELENTADMKDTMVVRYPQPAML